MNPNPASVPVPVVFTYKDLLLKKLYYAVICSVLSELISLQLFLLIGNINILHPVLWLCSSFRTLTSFSTWIFIVPFATIIFAQSVICAKDYVLTSTYSSTRYQKFISLFSLHNLVLFILHIVIGSLSVWLFLGLSDGMQLDSTICKSKMFCLVEESFFLILGGLWIGLYFFLNVYISEKHLMFPVINQRKLIQLRASALPLLKNSFAMSWWPILYYLILYYIWGSQLQHYFVKTFGFTYSENGISTWTYIYMWWIGSLYIFNMNLMRFFFNLFLTEPVELPLVKQSDQFLTLQESITMSSFPIVQKLACLDLSRLAQWSPLRRQLFYSLSQPGGHPHNWNLLVENVLKLIAEYTELLNKSTSEISVDPVKISSTVQTNLKSEEIILCSPPRPPGIRNMSMYERCNPLDVISISHNPLPGVEFSKTLKSKLQQKLNSVFSVLKTVLGINFFFGELPQANIQKALGNGQIIIWTSQGISDIVCASLKEDRYGIVQKDLPVIITSLVQLNQSLDKLNKIPSLTRKVAGFYDFNYRMKLAVDRSVKRNIFNICRNFGEYLNDLSLSKDVLHHLQMFTHVKS